MQMTKKIGVRTLETLKSCEHLFFFSLFTRKTENTFGEFVVDVINIQTIYHNSNFVFNIKVNCFIFFFFLHKRKAVTVNKWQCLCVKYLRKCSLQLVVIWQHSRDFNQITWLKNTNWAKRGWGGAQKYNVNATSDRRWHVGIYVNKFTHHKNWMKTG